MSFKIFYTPDFEIAFRRLARKYKSLPDDIKKLVESLRNDPQQGTSIGHNLYKVRIAIKSKGQGKSGGARVITVVFVDDEEIYLADIYDKSERSNISDNDLKKIAAKIKSAKLQGNL